LRKEEEARTKREKEERLRKEEEARLKREEEEKLRKEEEVRLKREEEERLRKEEEVRLKREEEERRRIEIRAIKIEEEAERAEKEAQNVRIEIRELQKQMERASKNMKFEVAAEYRDDIDILKVRLKKKNNRANELRQKAYDIRKNSGIDIKKFQYNKKKMITRQSTLSTPLINEEILDLNSSDSSSNEKKLDIYEENIVDMIIGKGDIGQYDNTNKDMYKERLSLEKLAVQYAKNAVAYKKSGKYRDAIDNYRESVYVLEKYNEINNGEKFTKKKIIDLIQQYTIKINELEEMN
ncbi:MAG: hypothetical protein GY870_10525, partial [archaeon]|nr:hypothetical protein [archaeon]